MSTSIPVPTITAEQKSEGIARLMAHNYGANLEDIVVDVYSGMRALEIVSKSKPEQKSADADSKIL